MGHQSPYSPYSGYAGLVDKSIGNAYPVVKYVHDNMDNIAYVAANGGAIAEAGNAALNTVEGVIAAVDTLNEIEARLEDVSTPLGSELMGHINDALAAEATTVHARLNWLAVHPEEFGAVESWDGVLVSVLGVPTTVDDTAAVQAALNTGRPVILRRLYRISDTLNSAGQLIEGNGYQTGFVFDSTVGKHGIVFAPTQANVTSSCYNFAIFKAGADGGTAIKTPYETAQYTTYRNSFQYEKLLIAGYTKPAPGTNNAFETNETWLCGIEQGDAWNIGLREVDCYGSYKSSDDPTGQVQSVFIRLQAENAMLTAHLSNFTCSNVYRGIELGDRCFFHISNFDIAHSLDGIYQIGNNVSFVGDGVTTAFTIPPESYGASSPNPPLVVGVRVVIDGSTKKLTDDYTYLAGVVTMVVAPELDAQVRLVIGMPFGESKILHGNINAQRYGIYFQDIGTREITGVVIRRHKFGWKDATYTWAGIRLVNANYVWINNCQIQPDAGNGDWPTSPAHGIQLVKCGGVTAIGTVIGANLDYGFKVDNTVMFNVQATQTFQTSIDDVLFYLTTNTRQSNIGSVVKVSTFKGTEYLTDGTVVLGAISGLDVVPISSAPRYNYKRPTSGVDEKSWRTTTGATSWALQLMTDNDASATNAIIATRAGTVCTSLEFRSSVLKLNNGPVIVTGSLDPNTNVTASPGSIYLRTTGGAITTLYIKESGVGNTGWVAK